VFNLQNFAFKLVENNPAGGPLGRNGSIVYVENGRLFSADGKRLDFSLQPSDVRIPEEIPTYLSGYRPFPFRADQMSPVVMVKKDEDYHRDMSMANAFRRVRVKVGPEGSIPEVDPGSTTSRYKTVDRLLGSFVPTITEDNAAGTHYRPRQVAAKRIGWALSLDRECDVCDLLTTSGNWASANVLSLGGTAKWNGGVDANPLGNINAMIIASAQPVTDIWMGQEAAFAFLADPTVRDQMRQFLGDGPAAAAMGQVYNAGTKNVDFMIPGYPPFHVSASKVLNETTGLLDYCLGPHCVGLTTPSASLPSDGEETATTHTFRVRGNVGVGYESREFRVEGRGQKGGTMVVVYQSDIAKFTANNCGFLIQNVIQ
jgi:hypothetical protein